MRGYVVGGISRVGTVAIMSAQHEHYRLRAADTDCPCGATVESVEPDHSLGETTLVTVWSDGTASSEYVS